MTRYISLHLSAVIVLCVLSLLPAGCSTAPSARLLEVEELMEQSPDSTLSMLQGVGSGGFHSDADKALYNLLLTQACYKNYKPLPSDSVIQTAVEYYDNAGDEARLMQARYYQGIIVRERGDYESAIPAALHAEGLARKLGSPLWIARTNELLSDIFYDNYNWEESMKHTEVAIENYDNAGKTINMYYSLLHKASLYSDLNQIHKSLALCDSIMSMRNEWINDTVLLAHTFDASFYPLIFTGQFDKGLEYMEHRRKIAIPASARTLVMWSYIYEHFNDLEKAEYCVSLSGSIATNESERLIVWLRLKELCALSADFKTSAEYSDSILDYYNRVLRNITVQSAYQIKNNYVKSSLEREQLNSLKLKYVSIFILSLLVLLIIILSLWNRYIVRRRKLDAKENMIAISELTAKLSNQQSVNEKLQDSANRLYSEHFNTINILCQEFFEGDTTDNDKLRIYKRAESEVSKLRNVGSLKEMIDFVDRNKNGRLSELFGEIPMLSDDEKKVITFICAGLSSKAISLVMGMKYKTFYTVKRRLKEKIAGLDVSETVKQWFLDSMTARK